MDITFWAGIILGGAIGFVVSIIANLTTPRFGELFTSSKAGWLERSKTRALRRYKFVMRFTSGGEDRYLYYLAQWGLTAAITSITGTFAVLSVIARTEIGRDVSSGAGVVGAAYVIANLVQLSLWHWRVTNFKQYEASLVAKWGNIE